jgi:hypothetical protein
MFLATLGKRYALPELAVQCRTRAAGVGVAGVAREHVNSILQHRSCDQDDRPEALFARHARCRPSAVLTVAARRYTVV